MTYKDTLKIIDTELLCSVAWIDNVIMAIFNLLCDRKGTELEKNYIVSFLLGWWIPELHVCCFT